VFRLVNAAEDEFRLRFRGVDPGRRYRVTCEPGGWDSCVAGLDLSQQGLGVRLDTALTSRLFLLEAE
jgi:hypothetical protein